MKLKDGTDWFLMKTLLPTLSRDAPTWAAYDSILGKKTPKTVVMMLPVINGNPTAWGNLCSVFKEAERLRRSVYSDDKTIISFDIQLYIKTTRLQERNDVKNGFVFRMGELHVVFCALKVIEKLIDGSGLDQAFGEAGNFK